MLSITIVLLLAFLCWTVLTALFVMYSQHLRKRKPYDPKLPTPGAGVKPSDFGLPYENIALITSDRLTIKGWYVPPANDQQAGAKPSPLIIALHGGMDDRRYYLPLLPVMNQAGFAMLLLDCRNHGSSDFDPRGLSTIGIREGRDLSAALDYLEAHKKHDRIGVVGVSNGSAAAIVAASHDQRIKAVVAESSGYYVAFIAQKIYRWMPWWMSYLFGSVLMLMVGAGFKNALRCRGPQLDLIKNIPAEVPVMFVHGRKDSITPLKYVEHLYQAKPGIKKLVVYDDARHAVIRFEEKKFVDVTRHFFLEHLT